MPKRRSNTKQLTLGDIAMSKADKAKDYRLRKRYGINLQRYNELLEEQNYECAICGKPHDDCKYGLVVDHNHRTGRVRGLLCTYCNRRVVGRIGDDRRRMQGFVAYIQRQLEEDTEWK